MPEGEASPGVVGDEAVPDLQRNRHWTRAAADGGPGQRELEPRQRWMAIRGMLRGVKQLGDRATRPRRLVERPELGSDGPRETPEEPAERLAVARPQTVQHDRNRVAWRGDGLQESRAGGMARAERKGCGADRRQLLGRYRRTSRGRLGGANRGDHVVEPPAQLVVAWREPRALRLLVGLAEMAFDHFQERYALALAVMSPQRRTETLTLQRLW